MTTYLPEIVEARYLDRRGAEYRARTRHVVDRYTLRHLDLAVYLARGERSRGVDYADVCVDGQCVGVRLSQGRRTKRIIVAAG